MYVCDMRNPALRRKFKTTRSVDAWRVGVCVVCTRTSSEVPTSCSTNTLALNNIVVLNPYIVGYGTSYGYRIIISLLDTFEPDL